jgi:hypothetical protein
MPVITIQFVKRSFFSDYSAFPNGNTWGHHQAGVAIAGHNVKVIDGITLEACKYACVTELSFECVAVEHHSDTLNCALSNVTR